MKHCGVRFLYIISMYMQRRTSVGFAWVAFDILKIMYNTGLRLYSVVFGLSNKTLEREAIDRRPYVCC